MFFKIVVVENFTNFTGKHLSRSLFNKAIGPQNYNFTRNRLQHRGFLVKFLRTPLLTEHLRWLLLTVLGFQLVTLLKKLKRLRQKCFSVNFAKFLRTSFDRTPLDDCFLCLSVNFEKFFRTLYL